MKPLQISEPASAELTEAIRWYEERRPGWGVRLFAAVTRAMALIESYPEIGLPRRGHSEARQLKVRGFPYLVPKAAIEILQCRSVPCCSAIALGDFKEIVHSGIDVWQVREAAN